MRENPRNVTTRRSVDLDVPPSALEPEAPLPSNVKPFPFIVGPHSVLAMAQRQRERATARAVARNERRTRQRR